MRSQILFQISRVSIEGRPTRRGFCKHCIKGGFDTSAISFVQTARRWGTSSKWRYQPHACNNPIARHVPKKARFGNFALIVASARGVYVLVCGARNARSATPTFHRNMPNLSELKSELLKALAEKSVRRGSFTLASGAQSDLYVDAKRTTLDPACALLVGKIGWELIKQTAKERNLRVDAVGGLTMGADPISLSIGIAACLDDPLDAPRIFNVRKEAKKHGMLKNLEGNYSAGDSVVVVDDVITTGGSTIQAIEKIEADGGKVARPFCS